MNVLLKDERTDLLGFLSFCVAFTKSDTLYKDNE